MIQLEEATEILSEALQLAIWFKSPADFFIDVWKHRGFYPNEHQKKFLEAVADLDNQRFLLCVASGGGKTLLLGTIAVWFCTVVAKILGKPQTVIIVGGSLEQSKLVYEYILEIINNNDWIKSLVDGEPLRIMTKFKDGSWIKALPCSDKSILGQHPNIMIIDEAVQVGDFIIQEALSRVGVHRDNKIFISSTPYEYLSLFVEMWMDTKKYSKWLRFHWSLDECHWVDKSILEEARQSLSSADYQIKFEGIPTPPTQTFFDHQAIRECRTSELLIPSQGETFLGIDWGMEHPTAIVIVRRTQEGNVYVVHIEQHRRKSGEFILERLKALCDVWKVQMIYADSEEKFMNRMVQQSGLPIRPIKFHTEKTYMLSNLKAHLESRRLRFWEGWMEFIMQLAKYDPSRKRDDDYVDALCLALYPLGKRFEMHKFPEKTKKVSSPDVWDIFI